MIEAEELNALLRLRPLATGTIGFYELLYEQEGERRKPYEQMMMEINSIAIAQQLASELLDLINGIVDRMDDGGNL